MPTYVNLQQCNYLEGIIFADSTFNKPGMIELLLGTQIHVQIIQEGLRKSTDIMPIAMNSLLSWILSGAVLNEKHTDFQENVHVQVDDSLKNNYGSFGK